MHQKKRKLFVLYSIPINLCKKLRSIIRFFSGRVAPARRRGCGALDLAVAADSFEKGITGTKLCRAEKYLVSYSIPLGCMVALLLIGIVSVNPGLFLVDKSSAVSIQDKWVVTDTGSNSSNYDSDDKENSEKKEVNDPAGEEFSGFGGDDLELSPEDQDAGISLLSNVSPTLAITISNSTQTINTVQGGPTVYGSYNIGLTGSNVKDYALSIKASSTNLTMPSGASSSTSTISGAGGKTGNSMTANTWGYKLTETSTAESSYGTLAYASLPTTLTQITNGTVVSPYNLNTSLCG